MNRRFINIVVCTMAATALFVPANSQSRASAAETRLVGVNLYDPGSKLISLYGSPLEIQAVTLGGNSTGPAGGGGRGSGGGAPAGAPGGGRGGRGGGGPRDEFNMRDGIGFGDSFLQVGSGNELTPNPNFPGGGGGAQAPAGAGGGGGGNAGGGVGGNTGGGDRVLYTRWVYKRGNSKYGFILDKFNRVVQMEAIGLNDGRVKTSRGVSFGSTFGTLVKKYGAPDGYEIAGDSLVVRFLIRHKVAFRLNRLGKDKPHQVTGIVVSAGKA